MDIKHAIHIGLNKAFDIIQQDDVKTDKYQDANVETVSSYESIRGLEIYALEPTTVKLSLHSALVSNQNAFD